MKKLLLVLSLLLVMLLLTSCAQKKDQYYISFTKTHGRGEEFTSEVFKFEIGSKELPELVASVPYTAQYPVTAYVDATEKVYYSSRVYNEDNLHSDQLFEYDIKTKESKQLTDNLFAINYIVPMDEGIFIVALTIDSEDLELRPMIYEYNSESLVLLPWDEELALFSLSYNPYVKAFAGAGFNFADQRVNIINQFVENPYTYQPNYIHTFELYQEPKLRFETCPLEIDTVILEKNTIRFSGDGNGKSKEPCNGKSFYEFNLENDELKFSTEPEIEDLRRFIGTNEDETLLYYLNLNMNLIELNMESGEHRTLQTSSIGTNQINNAVILKSGSKR